MLGFGMGSADNLAQVKRAESGSDIYGLIERVAYRLYLGGFPGGEGAHWFEAQRRVADYYAERSDIADCVGGDLERVGRPLHGDNKNGIELDIVADEIIDFGGL